MMTAAQIIEHYKLEPLEQEGGFFRQVWRSPHRLSHQALGSAYPESGDHPMGTVIYFLLTEDSFSAMHRLPTPEHWFYHLGDPAEMLLLHADGSSALRLLGSDLSQGQSIHLVTPSSSWQGTRLSEGGRHGYMFGSCVMIPGFEWTDFELGERNALSANYPEQAAPIRLRTRDTLFHGAV
jgi:predicted cupin superfamily sugar epimerase